MAVGLQPPIPMYQMTDFYTFGMMRVNLLLELSVKMVANSMTCSTSAFPVALA
jgi:hypothetical protein